VSGDTEYEAATGSVAVFDRSRRGRILVRGRAPGQMLKGVLTGVMPTPPTELPGGGWAGRATYHALLTPKGKMVTDLWATLLGDEAEAGFLLDVPEAGRDGLLASLVRVLPPRFASVDDASERTAMITVTGPDAARALSSVAGDLRAEASELTALTEGEWRAGDDPARAVLVQRTAEVWPDAWSVLGPKDDIGELRGSLEEAGAVDASPSTWSTLRVEAGRPLFGVDMDEDTIPTEAGIDGRAIDHAKGCYTGQEVIVRIRDRGHVNRMLRRLQLGDVEVPEAGTALLSADGSGKAVGRITTAVRSPRYGGVLALAYVARGHETVVLDGQERPVPS